ncbi:hypothetical protein KOI35_30635 [Actinoplanes bogorensis]|uniref:Uncharacterized protein n=1 Tax=Paractinoplanes bogorensis TaxID=1610840 RepID=A0ABS5YYU1_9ACTN|nr:hypothetical protein [Actinoplanes bogorensis]MBU2667878.1 hypothetical protein [Actinoplanes bogorensis]
MRKRLAAVLAALVMATVAVSAPAAAAEAPGCATVTFDSVRGVYRPDSTRWEPWFDVTLKGRSKPCAPGRGAATLAITQYHVRDGATVASMSTPWQVKTSGTTSFSRTGRIEPDVAALCVSTGLTEQNGEVRARNVACVKPRRTGDDHLVTSFPAVALTDPLVTAPLSTYPTGRPPTAPVCTANCLVSPFTTYPPGAPTVTKDTPIDGPVQELSPYEQICHFISVSDMFAGPSDRNVNGFDVWMAVDTGACDENEWLTLHVVRYWADRGIVMPPWDMGQYPLEKGAQVNENTVALCITSGIRAQGNDLYGEHDECWRVTKPQPDRYRLVPISTTDPRVTKRLVSNWAVPDPDNPPGVCASCL